MTRYDFTTQPNRLNQNTMKWHEAESDPELLELWVADMDFLPVPEIRDAVINYAETHIFGYPYPSDELYQSIIDWEKNQHGYSVDKASIVLIEGVSQLFQQLFSPLPKKTMLSLSTHQFIHLLLVLFA
ncbi:Transaminase (aminotransferase) [Streptococcus thermophilus CNCM I-1630]|nr:Transaminase (aminotransferase) [Streptococcus thermophilus CNCM I-1630]